MEYKKCGSCGCFKSIEDIGCRKSGIVYKCCKRCRNKVNDKVDEPVKEKNEPVFDEIITETPNNINMDKCIICLNIWDRPKDIYPITINDITCYSCREKGEIKDELYNLNEPVKKKPPRFIPDSSSESD